MYMHYYGGVYADLDFESVKPMDDYLKGKQLVLGRMGPDIDHEHSIPNAVMASIPGHPFWVKILDYISDNINSPFGVEEVNLHVLFYS